jgi:hypothetical protein
MERSLVGMRILWTTLTKITGNRLEPILFNPGFHSRSICASWCTTAPSKEVPPSGKEVPLSERSSTLERPGSSTKIIGNRHRISKLALSPFEIRLHLIRLPIVLTGILGAPPYCGVQIWTPAPADTHNWTNGDGRRFRANRFRDKTGS